MLSRGGDGPSSFDRRRRRWLDRFLGRPKKAPGVSGISIVWIRYPALCSIDEAGKAEVNARTQDVRAACDSAIRREIRRRQKLAARS